MGEEGRVDEGHTEGILPEGGGAKIAPYDEYLATQGVEKHVLSRQRGQTGLELQGYHPGVGPCSGQKNGHDPTAGAEIHGPSPPLLPST